MTIIITNVLIGQAICMRYAAQFSEDKAVYYMRGADVLLLPVR